MNEVIIGTLITSIVTLITNMYQMASYKHYHSECCDGCVTDIETQRGKKKSSSSSSSSSS
jgi:hypothetical protein